MDPPSMSGTPGISAEHPDVQKILIAVRELGRQPMEIKSRGTAAESAEYKLARQIRRYKLRDRVQDVLNSLTETQRRATPCWPARGDEGS